MIHIEADWGEEDDEAADQSFADQDDSTKAEHDVGDVSKENGFQDAAEDAQEAGADAGESPEAASGPDEAVSPPLCLGVLKMHNPKRDFGFISPLLSIPKSVQLPKGADGLWFFGAPQLQGKGPLVGCEVLFNVCTGKDGQSKTQAVDIVLADEDGQEEESIKSDMAQNEAVSSQRKQELLGANKADEDYAATSTHVAPSEPSRHQEPRAPIPTEQGRVEARPGVGIERGHQRPARTLQHQERFSARAVKGETWSSDVGFTRVKIEYQESAETRKSKAMGSGPAQDEAKSSKIAAHERADAFSQQGTSRMQETDGMQRLRNLVEEGPYYKCFPCKAAMKGQCLNGTACPDAHTLQEVKPLPDTKLVRKTAKRSIMDFMQSGAQYSMPPGMMMWGVPSMGMGMQGVPPFGVPPVGAFPPYVRPKKKKKKSRYSD